MSRSDLFALYGALAAVAAITTALQAAVALLPLGQYDVVNERRRRSSPGQQAYNDAVVDAKRYHRAGWLLNVGAVGVNAAVLASWGYVVFRPVSGGSWFLRVPFYAVAIAATYLLVVAAVGLSRLHGIRH
jgi:hypothetical protein